MLKLLCYNKRMKNRGKNLNYLSNKNGFALPAVLITSVTMLIVLLASVSSIVSIRTSLTEQYYNKLAQNAQEAGIAYAKACLEKAGDEKATWDDNKPLRPYTDCSGNKIVTDCETSSPSDGCFVTYISKKLKTSFTVGKPSTNSANLVIGIKSKGTVNLLRDGGAITWRQYNQNTVQEHTPKIIAKFKLSTSIYPIANSFTSFNPSLNPSVGENQYDVDSTISITADAESNNMAFSKWTGSAACNDKTDNSINIIMTGDLTCTANYGPKLTVYLANGEVNINRNAGICISGTTQYNLYEKYDDGSIIPTDWFDNTKPNGDYIWQVIDWRVDKNNDSRPGYVIGRKYNYRLGIRCKTAAGEFKNEATGPWASYTHNPTTKLVKLLVVGGGGAGGDVVRATKGGGGGGGGGVIYKPSYQLQLGVRYHIIVGAGGGLNSWTFPYQRKGLDSYFGPTIKALGGGCGTIYDGSTSYFCSSPDNNGANGGGGAGYPTGSPTMSYELAGSSIDLTGYSGGNGANWAGGGGGGALSKGVSATANNGGAGGTGYTSKIASISDTISSFYGCGGGGGGDSGGGAIPDCGGKGQSSSANVENGKVNTGGGGGGGNYTSSDGGLGGSGVVIIRYKKSDISGATISSNCGTFGTNYSFTYNVTDGIYMFTSDTIAPLSSETSPKCTIIFY